MEHPEEYIKTVPPSYKVSTSEFQVSGSREGSQRFVLVLIIAGCIALGAAFVLKVL